MKKKMCLVPWAESCDAGSTVDFSCLDVVASSSVTSSSESWLLVDTAGSGSGTSRPTRSPLISGIKRIHLHLSVTWIIWGHLVIWIITITCQKNVLRYSFGPLSLNTKWWTAEVQTEHLTVHNKSGKSAKMAFSPPIFGGRNIWMIYLCFVL